MYEILILTAKFLNFNCKTAAIIRLSFFAVNTAVLNKTFNLSVSQVN